MAAFPLFRLFFKAFSYFIEAAFIIISFYEFNWILSRKFLNKTLLFLNSVVIFFIRINIRIIVKYCNIKKLT